MSMVLIELFASKPFYYSPPSNSNQYVNFNKPTSKLLYYQRFSFYERTSGVGVICLSIRAKWSVYFHKVKEVYVLIRIGIYKYKHLKYVFNI